MVNKTAVGLLGVVIVASLGVGVLIGMQRGGGADTATTTVPSSGDQTGTPTPSQSGTSSSSTTETPAGESTEQRTTIPARQFDEGEIASHVAEFVNQERQNRDLQRLETGDATSTTVAAMARNHSVGMADAGNVTHEVEGVDTAGRYRQNELFERCKFKSPEGSYIRQPDEEFELIGMSYAGTPYQDDGEEQFNGDERAVARAIVDDWMQSSEYSERLLVKGPTRMGVGVEVTDGGKVYATMDVCA